MGTRVWCVQFKRVNLQVTVAVVLEGKRKAGPEN